MQTPTSTEYFPSIFAPTPPPSSPVQWMIVSPIPQSPIVINWNDIEAVGEAEFHEHVRQVPERTQSCRNFEKSLIEFRKCILKVLLRRRLRIKNRIYC